MHLFLTPKQWMGNNTLYIIFGNFFLCFPQRVKRDFPFGLLGYTLIANPPLDKVTQCDATSNLLSLTFA